MGSPWILETATDWTRLDATRRAIETTLRNGLTDLGEVVVPFTHLSHVYPTGSSIYTTYLFRIAPDPAETLRRWTVLKEAVSRAVVAHGATISHQHGVGVDHRPFLEPEKGRLGLDLIRGMATRLDPDRILNPASSSLETRSGRDRVRQHGKVGQVGLDRLGGGIVGAGIAREAAQQGCRYAIDQGDFSSGTPAGRRSSCTAVCAISRTAPSGSPIRPSPSASGCFARKLDWSTRSGSC